MTTINAPTPIIGIMALLPDLAGASAAWASVLTKLCIATAQAIVATAFFSKSALSLCLACSAAKRRAFNCASN